jgi:hypothetical protein
VFERVVIILAVVLDADVLAQIAEFGDDLRIIGVDLNRRDVFDDRFDLFDDVRDENRVIGAQVTTRFLNDLWGAARSRRRRPA